MLVALFPHARTHGKSGRVNIKLLIECIIAGIIMGRFAGILISFLFYNALPTFMD